MATSELDQDRIGLDEQEVPEDGEEDTTGGTMSLVEHLEELRKRIIICAITIALGSIVGFIFWKQIMNFLLIPLPATSNALTAPDGAVKLVASGIGEPFSVALKLSVAVGIGLGAPVLLYQLWAFVSPGLTKKERRWAGPFVLIGVLLFLIGLAVGFVTLRFPVNFLIDFGKDNFLELVTADSYFTFVAFFMLAFGVVFELPLVLTFLAQVGIVSSKLLRSKRAVALVVLWILSTFITPGTDPYSPIVLGTAMTILYELSIILIRVTGK